MDFNVGKVKIVASPKEAPNYQKYHPEIKAAQLGDIIIVRKGTVEGRSTVDIHFEDEAGNKFVTMTTGRIIRMIAQMIGEEG